MSRRPDSRESPPTPAVSLVVCTRDRAGVVGACLEAVAAMRPAVACELVLVDNGSTDGTPALLAEFAARAPIPVTVVREPRPGLARARNAGVAASRAPLLVFTDDDCYPAPDLLDRYAELFADPRLGYAAGRVLLHDPEDFPITIRTDAEPRAVAPYGFVEPGVVQGANMAFRREVVYALGGFDPALGPGGTFNFEDLDMASRAAAAGYAGGYFPGPVVHHHHRRRAAGDVAALKRSYDRGRGAYFASLVLRGRVGRDAARYYAYALRQKSSAEIAREIVAAAHYAAYRMVRPARRPLSERNAHGDDDGPA